MASIKKTSRDFFEWVKHRPTQVSAYIPIEQDHIDDENGWDEPFVSDQHYFRAFVSEMFLLDGRQWLTEYDPIVFSALEFNYDQSRQEEPKLVGPELLGQGRPAAPQGTLYLETPASGLHPYRGGDLTFTVILYRAKRSNHLANLLKIVEKVVGAVDPSIAFASYINMANIITEGLDLILNGEQTDPIIGIRNTLPAPSEIKPGYYALINASERSVNRESLWIRDGRLQAGDSLQTSKPYRDHDFVLFKLMKYQKRDDVNVLPFYHLWEEARKRAIEPASWEEAKSIFTTLYRELLISPDLTESQKDSLRKEYMGKLKDLRRHGFEHQQLGASRYTYPDRNENTLEKLDELRNLYQELD